MSAEDPDVVNALLRVFDEAWQTMQDAEYRWLVAGDRSSDVREQYENAYARHEAAKALLRDHGVRV